MIVVLVIVQLGSDLEGYVLSYLMSLGRSDVPLLDLGVGLSPLLLASGVVVQSA